MNTTNNTVLITGGGSGIGFQTAALLAAQGNRVIITGRNKEKLEKAAAQIPGATAIVADITDAAAVDSLVERIHREFPDLNILFNNAAHAVAYTLSASADAYSKAADEFNTNVLSVIRLTEKLWPLLEKQPHAAIVNITSIVSMVPGLRIPTYSATKAALHSYTQSLRVALSSTNVKVFEVMPPLVDTEFAKELSGSKMQPADVASEIVTGIANNIYEIHIGVTAAFRQLFLQSPETALRHLNNLPE
ncbi:SDR family NAD(P)-dependent oxidoreductase [Terrimonas sp. NA20]|uniref:SDR family NAD(P)-dependent oxidoreductase n=1 Tax=Terrimonas ginsenosidimutans TaxID=2908004 RepID=A0ABS9KZ11_9BACT|nr:SDR family NAD(P)-dependent oxidoreductase [Terrimonas ginsenosidimutans]MCG2617550.1 SDR family NAD(P)-dependent oxidoreductase [Terrimonas ginsenosidimutans]